MDELSYEERLVKCGLVSLELRRLRKDLAICYQIINGLISLNFKDFLCPKQITELGEINKSLKFLSFLNQMPEQISFPFELFQYGTL